MKIIFITLKLLFVFKGSADLGDSHSTIWPDGILYYEIDDFVFDSTYI